MLLLLFVIIYLPFEIDFHAFVSITLLVLSLLVSDDWPMEHGHHIIVRVYPSQ